MRTIPVEFHRRHDELATHLREQLKRGDGKAESISDGLGREVGAFVEDLKKLGADLYEADARENALALMSYWIHALYRGGWYQDHCEEPPFPELDDYSEERRALVDADYPFPRLAIDGRETTEESVAIWRRQGEGAAGVLVERGIIGVTGTAGCGRSHFIEHGLVPALRERGVVFDVVRFRPVERFRTARGAVGTGLLGIEVSRNHGEAEIIDEQDLEEDGDLLSGMMPPGSKRFLILAHDVNKLFTLDENPQRSEPSLAQTRFMDVLYRCAMAGHLVVIDLQQNFVGKIRRFEELSRHLDEARPRQSKAAEERSVSDGWIVVHHEASELRDFICDSADRAGLQIEYGLVERLVADHQAEPAAFPLLLFTLRRLWLHMLAHQDDEYSRRNMLTWKGYVAVKSARLGLEKAAEEAMAELSSSRHGVTSREVLVVKSLFMKMIRLLPGSGWWLSETSKDQILESWRREERARLAPILERTVDAFRQVGLVLTVADDGERMTMVHPALVNRWSRLVTWLEERREESRWTWLLKADARAWRQWHCESEDMKRRYNRIRCALERYWLLWRGTKLAEAIESRDKSQLTANELAFLRASRTAWFARRLFVVGLLFGVVMSIALSFEQLASHEMALFMERGASAEALGDLAVAGPWFGAAQSPDRFAPISFLASCLPQWLQSKKFKSRREARAVGAKLALDRFPELLGLAVFNDGLISTDFSPDGQWVALARRAADGNPGELLLWHVPTDRSGGKMVRLALPPLEEMGENGERKLAEEVQATKVVFLPSQPEDSDSRNRLAVAFSSQTGRSGGIGVWRIGENARTIGKPDWLEVFDGSVSDFALEKCIDDEKTSWILLVGFTALPANVAESQPHGARIYEIDSQFGRVVDRIDLGDGSRDQPVTEWVARLALSGHGFAAIGWGKSGTTASPASRVDVYSRQDGWVKPIVSESLDIGITDLAFSPKGDTLAAGGATAQKSGRVVVWPRLQAQEPGEEATRPPVTFERQTGVTRVLFSPDGALLASTGQNGNIGIWKEGNEKEPRWESFREIPEGGWTWSAAWSHDGRWLATGNRDRHVRLWSAETGALAFPPLHHGQTIGTLNFAADGLSFLSTTPTSARVWASQPRVESARPWGAEGRVPMAEFSRHGDTAVVLDQREEPIATAGSVTTLRVWMDGQVLPLDLFPAFPEDADARICDVALSQDGKIASLLLRGNLEEEEVSVSVVRCWNLETQQPGRWSPVCVDGRPERLDLFRRNDGSVIAVTTEAVRSGGIDSISELEIVRFSVDGSKEDERSVQVPFEVQLMAYSEARNLLALGGRGENVGRLGIYDLEGSALGVVAPGQYQHQEAITALAFDARGERLVTGSRDDRVRLFKIHQQGRFEWMATGEHTADVTAVGFANRRADVVSTSRDETAILWTHQDARLTQLVRCTNPQSATCFALTLDDQWLAVGGGNEVRVYSTFPTEGTSTAQLVAVLPHRQAVKSVAFGEGLNRSDALTLSSLAYGNSLVMGGSLEAQRWHWPRAFRDERLRQDLELITARKIVGLQMEALESKELSERWDSGDKHAAFAEPASRHKRAFISAAAAGEWWAARFHLERLRRAAMVGGERRVFDSDLRQVAIRVGVAMHDPALVISLIEEGMEAARVASEAGPSPFESEKKQELLAVSKIQLARFDPGQRNLLKEAEDLIVHRLRAKERPNPDYRIWLAEIAVLRGDYDEAARWLQGAIKPADAPRDSTVIERIKNLLTEWRILGEEKEQERAKASVIQRLGAVYLRKNDVEAWKRLCEDVAQEKMRDNAAVRMAWTLVSSPHGSEGVRRAALEISEDAYRRGNRSYTQLNTYALAHLRNGNFDEAISRLQEGVSAYKSGLATANAAGPFDGRPVDWIVEALIRLARAEASQSEDPTQEYARAEELIKAVENQLADPTSFTEWRASWNILDLEILVAEANHKLEIAKALRQPQARVRADAP